MSDAAEALSCAWCLDACTAAGLDSVKMRSLPDRSGHPEQERFVRDAWRIAADAQQAVLWSDEPQALQAFLKMAPISEADAVEAACELLAVFSRGKHSNMFVTRDSDGDTMRRLFSAWLSRKFPSDTGTGRCCVCYEPGGLQVRCVYCTDGVLCMSCFSQLPGSLCPICRYDGF